MKSKMKLIKSLSLVFALATVLVLAQGQARADEVTIGGFTTGTVSGAPSVNFLGTPYTGFVNTTYLGVGAFSGQNVLGTFNLSSGLGPGPVSGTFTLNVEFVTPVIINGGQTHSFVAGVRGSVQNTEHGGVMIDFDNNPVTFTFSDGFYEGYFTLALADVYVETNSAAYLTAGTTGEQHRSVPEPATLLLLGSGLAGIAARLRKRSKLSTE